MAKKKLTIEDVLVPKEEIPYKVPENWCWVKLNYVISTLETGKRPKGGVAGISNGIPSLGGEHLRYDGGFNIEKIRFVPYDFVEQMKKGIIEENDILIVKDGATTGKASFVDKDFPFNKAVINEHVFKCRSNEKVLLPKYLYRFISSPLGQQFIKNNLKGSAQGGINTKFIDNYVIPLPPLSEQERIVNRIESLFEKIDKSSELVEEAREGFEKRRAAILEKAFSGELTKRWREENNVNCKIDVKKFKDIATIKSNLVKPQEYMDYPHIAPDNIEKKTGRLLEYRTIEEDGVKSAKHKFFPNQILYSKIRPYLSKVVLVDFEGLCSADMYPIETELEIKYLYWYMLSQKFLDYASNCGSRSVLPKINQKELGEIPVPIMTSNEQKEVVKILDKLIEEEKCVEDICSISENIDIIKKSILSKAFRGELGCNDLNEESSIALLKEIMK